MILSDSTDLGTQVLLQLFDTRKKRKREKTEKRKKKEERKEERKDRQDRERERKQKSPLIAIVRSLPTRAQDPSLP